MNEDFLVFDLETQRTAEQVGGWRNIADMKMSVGVVWDHLEQRHLVFYEEQVFDLIDLLSSGRPVVGFNHIGFDYTVLGGYFSEGSERTKAMKKMCHPANLDMLVEVQNILGHRLKLDSIAKATLAIGKSADGLMALKWWEQYQQTDDGKYLQKIVDYCVQDVSVTRDVFLHGLKNGKVYFDNKGLVKIIKVNWKGLFELKQEGTALTENDEESGGGEQLSLF